MSNIEETGIDKWKREVAILRKVIKRLQEEKDATRNEGYLNGREVGFREGWAACGEKIIEEMKNG